MYDIILDAEFCVLNLISKISCDFLDSLMVFFSSLANKGAVWIIFAALLFVFKKTRRIGACVAIALLVNFLLVNVITKPLVHRMRPYDIDKALKIIIPLPHDFSFPSGHTSASFAAACAFYPHNRNWGIVCIVLAFVIAFSRLYLCVHFPTDVLFGIFFGLLSAFISNYICKKYKIFQ